MSRRGGIKELAKEIGISVGAVRKAIGDGRISTFVKSAKGYEFDIELAVQEYELNTNPSLSSNSNYFADDSESDSSDGSDDGLNSGEVIEPSEDPNPKKFFVDRDPRSWNVNQASQAFAIFKALKMKHELEVSKGKFYPKKEADQELDRIINTFTRSLIQLPTRLKQKIPTLTDRDLLTIKSVCQDLTDELKRKL